MTGDDLTRTLVQATPVEVLRQFRPPRAAIVLPLVRALFGDLRGLRVLEIGSGEPLLLAKALLAEGAIVTAIDPALSDPRVDAGGIQVIARDVFDLDPHTLGPFDLTMSTLLFGAPLRQRARRAMWPAYRSGSKPSEDEVLEVLGHIEGELISRAAAWTRPGGWTLHLSLERLFAAPVATWEHAGWDVVVAPRGEEQPATDDAVGLARWVLAGMLIARRASSGSGMGRLQITRK